MNTRATRATLISALGVAVGLALGSASATTYRLADLGTLGGAESFGGALNASGQVTGGAATGDGGFHAFLWDGTTMQDLGTLGGTSSGSDINDSGQVTGYSYTTPTGDFFHAFLWDGYAMRDLGTLGGTYSQGHAINASGQVTGWAATTTTDGFTPFHAFVWDGTMMQDLGALADSGVSEGVAINAAGQVTGFSINDAFFHAFLWDGTTLQDLGTLGGVVSYGLAINAAGQVTGGTWTIDEIEHAFLWDGTAMQDLGTLGGAFAAGVAINAAGQVAGNATTAAGDFFVHAFLWDGRTLVDLGTLGGPRSEAVAINASGQVTGYSLTADETFHTFLWDGSTLHDLNALIDPSDPLQPYVTLTTGADINDRGQILANGIDNRTGENHAYLVSPIAPAPNPAAQVEALVEVVLSLNLKAGIGKALDSKLQNALAALNRGLEQDNGSAVGILSAFIHSVEAQRGKALSTEQADQLVSAAQDVIDAL